jgi:hypothetical protein
MSNSYHQVLRRFCDARHNNDTPRTLVRARRLVGSSLAAAERVGPEGLVLGIDIAPGLLAAAAGAGIALPPIHGPLASAAAIRRQLQQASFGSCRIT